MRQKLVFGQDVFKTQVGLCVTEKGYFFSKSIKALIWKALKTYNHINFAKRFIVVDTWLNSLKVLTQESTSDKKMGSGLLRVQTLQLTLRNKL